MNIPSKMIDIIIAISSFVLIIFCSACEKKVETRNKPEYGRDTVTITDDVNEYGRYEKRYDHSAIEEQKEEQDRRKADSDRSSKIQHGIEDGTLMEKYGAH